MRSLLVSLLMFLAPLAYADAPPSDSSLKELFALMNTRMTLDSVMQQMQASMRAQMSAMTQGQNLNDAQRQVLADAADKMAALLQQSIDWSSLEPMMIKVYQETFTQSEIQGMVKFYSSPTGKAVTAKLPLATQRAMQEMQGRVQALRPQLIQLQQDMVAKLKAAGSAPGAATPQ